MRLILVRHGHTIYNEENRYQGQSDIPLNEKGLEQAKLLRKRFKNEKIEIIFSSDLKRAFQTAEEIVKGRNIKIIKDERLREINYGVFEGLNVEEIKSKYNEILENWWNQPFKTRIPKGEKLKDLEKRVSQFLKEIFNKYKHKNVMIVSHSGPLRIIVLKCLNLPLSLIRSIRFDNASVSIVEIERKIGGVLSLLNDTSHL
jgi:alpha-ribazole phosphatase